MGIPKAAWWVLAPLAWLWQYLVYVPAHWLVRAVLVLWLGLAGDPIDRIWEKPIYRPWFIERLR